MMEGIAQFGLNANAVLSSVFYAALGLVLMVIFVSLIDKLLHLNFHKELIEDQNIALAILVAGMSIGIAIIIAAAIH